MAQRATTFGRIDGWVLASMGHPERGMEDTDLFFLIHVADLLNHSIPELDEIRGALRLLYRYGVVEFGDIGVRRTPHGHMVAQNCLARRGGLFSIVENMTNALNSPRIKHPTVTGTPDLSYFTKRRYEAALKKWHRVATEALRPKPGSRRRASDS